MLPKLLCEELAACPLFGSAMPLLRFGDWGAFCGRPTSPGLWLLGAGGVIALFALLPPKAGAGLCWQSSCLQS